MILWSHGWQVAGNMEEVAPYVLDRLSEERRAKFDNNLARVIAKALEKKVERRYQCVDEMHEAIYACLIDRGEAVYRWLKPRASLHNTLESIAQSLPWPYY